MAITTWTPTPVVVAHMARNHLGMQDMFGGLLYALNDANPKSAVEQLNDSYLHGGGWHSFKGFFFDPRAVSLRYPGDPPMRAIGETQMRDERVILFEASWVAVIGADGVLIDVARMD